MNLLNVGKIEIYRNNFSFHATRFEEWMNGLCYNKGTFETDIVAESTKRNIHFYISEIGNFKISKTSVFEFGDEITELVLDRIIYNHIQANGDSLTPIECQLFRSGVGVSCIRFTMPSLLRIIEFYGYTTEIGQKHRHAYVESISKESAESIISQLKSTHQYDEDSLMNSAYKLFEENSNASTSAELDGIVESLKLFVEVYKLLFQNSIEEGKTPMLMPKVYFFIALCNFKICNIKQAYVVAKEGLKKVDSVIKDSVFVNLPPNLLGSEDLKHLISVIENQFPNVIHSNYGDVMLDPCVIDTGIIKSMELNSSPEIESLTVNELEKGLKKLCSIQDSLKKLYKKTQSGKVVDTIEKIEEYKYPFYHAWMALDANTCPEVEEGTIHTSLFNSYISNLDSEVNRLCKTLNEDSLFRRILKNDNVTDYLVKLYTLILDNLTHANINIEMFVSHKNTFDIENVNLQNKKYDNEEEQIPSILREVLVFKSNEHQRFEHGVPVKGLQKCLRTIQIEVNKNGCKGYDIKPGDGFIVRMFNNDNGSAQMSAKPMRLYKKEDDMIELRGYPLMAISPFGWQPVDYSEFSLTLHLENGVWKKCCLHLLDRDVVIEYRYKNTINKDLLE